MVSLETVFGGKPDGNEYCDYHRICHLNVWPDAECEEAKDARLDQLQHCEHMYHSLWTAADVVIRWV